MEQDIIVTKDLTKKFKNLTAVNKINLKIKKGEVFGLLGPNGAGKTTTISMLSTLVKPTSGTAEVNGYNIKESPNKVRESIGLVFQDSILDLDLNALDNLDFHARLYKLPKELKENRINEVVKLVDLTKHLKKRVEKFSGGMKRRLEIAKGLLHHPKVLFLDEPTLGLDPQTRRHIWNHILKLKKEEKVTILLTTHYMEEADYLCDRVGIIDNGKIIVIGEPKKLKSKLKGDVIEIKINKVNNAIVKNIKKLEGVKEIEVSENKVSILTNNAESKIAKFVEVIKKSDKVEIEAIYIHKPTLEDVFLHYTGREMRDDT